MGYNKWEWDWECSSVSFIVNNWKYHPRQSLWKLEGKGEPERENLLSVFFSYGGWHLKKNCGRKLHKGLFLKDQWEKAAPLFLKFCKLKQNKHNNKQQNLDRNKYNLLWRQKSPMTWNLRCMVFVKRVNNRRFIG